MSIANIRVRFVDFLYHLRDLLRSMTARILGFGGVVEIELPFAGTGRTPARLVSGDRRGEILLISRPPTNEPFGLHPIFFDDLYGFSWSGDYYDPELPSTTEIEQVCGGTHAFIRYTDSSGTKGIRVYAANHSPPNQQIGPVVQLLDVLHQNQHILDMMSISFQDGFGEFLVLTNECFRHRYSVAGTSINWESEWDPYDRPPPPDGGGVRIIIDHNAGMILMECPDRAVLALRITYESAGVIQSLDPFLFWQEHTYWVPNFPEQEPFGDRHKRFFWYGFNPEHPCEGANLYLTGTNEWIKAYEWVRGLPRLMKFRLLDGTLHDLYSFPEISHDWDAVWKGGPCIIPCHVRGIDLIRATSAGLKLEHLSLEIYPESLVSVIQVGSSRTLAEGTRHSVLWSKGPRRGYYSVGDDKLYFSRRGVTRYRGISGPVV